MKKLLSLLMLGLVSCSSCSKKQDVVPPKPVPTVVVNPLPDVLPPQHVDGDTWAFIVPGEWKKLNNVEGGPGEAEVSYMQSDEHQLLSLSKEAFTGTYEEYVLSGIRSLKEAGVNVQSATQVTLNGNTFVLLETSKGITNAWMWVTVAKGIGYNFSCGGSGDETKAKSVCTQISKTLEIQK